MMVLKINSKDGSTARIKNWILVWATVWKTIKRTFKARKKIGLLSFCFALMLSWSLFGIAESGEVEKVEVDTETSEKIVEASDDKKGLSEEARTILEHMDKERLGAEERFKLALQQQREEAEARERILLGVLIVLVVTIISAVLVYSRRDKRKQKTEVRASVPPSAPSDSKTVIHHQKGEAEYVLDGRDEEGVHYVLTLTGDELLQPEGVVLGRNPVDSRFLINHADVSRRHAKMSFANNRLFIEDLGSTNGTSVNGQTIDEKGPVAVANGDQLIIGSVVMKLNVMQE